MPKAAHPAVQTKRNKDRLSLSRVLFRRHSIALKTAKLTLLGLSYRIRFPLGTWGESYHKFHPILAEMSRTFLKRIIHIGRPKRGHDRAKVFTINFRAIQGNQADSNRSCPVK